MSQTVATGKPRKVPIGERSPSSVEQGGHTPLPFDRRYRRALSDAQLQRNLLNFQRSWRVSRDEAWSAYGRSRPAAAGGGAPSANPHVHIPDTPGSAEFVELRDRLAAIKDGVI